MKDNTLLFTNLVINNQIYSDFTDFLAVTQIRLYSSDGENLDIHITSFQSAIDNLLTLGLKCTKTHSTAYEISGQCYHGDH